MLALVCLALVWAPLTAATATWDGGGGDGAWTNPLNWSADVQPGAADDVILTGPGPISITSAVTVRDLTVSADFSGTLMAGATVSVTRSCQLLGGTWLAGTQILSVGGDLIIADRSGAFLSGTGTVLLAGTGQLSNPHPDNAFHRLITAPAGHTTRVMSSLTITRLLTIGAGLCDIRQNAAARQIHLRGSGTVLERQGSGSLQGWWPNGCELWFESDGSAPMELPGMDYGQCAVRMLALGGASATFNQMGPMTNVHYVTTATESIYQRVTWNTNNHPVNVTVFLATGYQGSGGGTTWNAGSSVVNTGANFCWFTSSSDVINLGSSQLAAASIAAWSVSSQINPGTSTVTLTGGSIGVPWITRHLPFWNLTLAGSATTSVTPYGDLQVGKDLTIAGGTLASAARAVTVQGSLTVGDAGRLAVTTGTVSVGANLTLPDVAGAFAAGTGSVVLTGTGTLSAPGQAFHDLTTAPSGRSTRPLSDLLITHRLTVGGLLDLRQNAAVRQVHLRGSGQMLVVQPGGSIQGWFPNGGELCFEATGAAPMDLPGLDYGQCGIRLRTQGAVIGTFNQSGAIRNAHFLTTSADHVGGRTVWNTNGHDVALTVYLLTGTDGSMGGTTWNAGTSRIEAGSNFCWFTHASDVINLQDCRLSAGGFATWVPQVQVDPGTSTVAVRGGVGVPWWPHLHRLANLQLTGSGPGYLHGPVQCSGDVAIGSGGLQAGGELILDGAAPSTLDVAGPGVLAALRIAKPAGLQVSSALALQSLVVDPGSTVQWAAGRTVTTQVLQLLGTAEQPIALASTQSGSPWLLNAAAPSPTAWVRVSDSDARAGATIDATDHGVDLGSNQNWRFTIQHVAQPTISLASGTYQAAQNVTLSCATPSVVFRFSLDGSDPALSPLTTTESVLVSASATLRVVAERSGWQTSPEASATYVLQVQPVTASLPAGSHVGPQAVTLGCPTPGTTIVYTLDGTDPASSSTVAIATGPVQLPGSCTLRAIATLAGWSASAQFQAAYALQVAMPTITPASGAVTAGTSVVISADAGILRYTTDGSDPAASASSQEAASPVSLPITAAMTVRAIGRTAGWTDSAEVSAAFSIQGGGGGDPEPPTAEVALAVVPADLTGQKFWNGLQLTNLPTVRFTVQATRVTSGWSVARLGVDSQGGSWSGASPVAADLPEGQQTVVAWAEVSKDGLTHRIVGQSLDLLVDRSEPVITLLEPGHTDGTKTLDAGMLSAGGRPLLLNRAADASALREIAGWRSWSVDGLDIPVLVEDVSGVDPDTAPTASIGSSALTVQLATPSTGGRDILHLTRFDAVPDAVKVDPATLVLLAGAGMQLLEVAVVDRCGNAATATMCSVWKKTTAGGAAFGYVPHQVGGFPASIGILDAQRHSSLAPVALLATPSDIVAVDQYAVAVNGVVTSLGSAMRLTQGADWAGLPGQGPALWQLRPVAADNLGNMRSGVVIRDATGNTLGTPSTPFPIITAWRPTRATAPEASTTLLQTEVELQTDRIEMRTLWSGWQLQGQWTGWLSRDTYLGYGWPTGIWVNYPVLTYSLAHVGRVGSTRSTQAPIPWEIEQPTEGAKLMVEMEGAASTLLTKVVTGVPESVHYGTITATHPGITGDGITYEGKLPIRIQDGPSNAVVEVVTAKPAPFTRDEARFVGIGPWDTHVYAQVQHERRVLDLQSGMLAWNTILDRPTQGPLVAAVPPSWSTAPMIVRYAPLADAGQVVVADANLPPITVSADAGGHLEIPMDRSLPGGFARVQRRKTAADGAQSWQHLGFRGMDLVKILGDVLATGQQTLRLEGGFQSQLSAKLPALSPMGNIRIIASTRRSWSEARLAGLAPRSAGNLDVIGTWLDAIASDAQVDMSGADAVAAGAASRQLATSLLMRQRELQSGMNAATRGVSASTLQAQYQAQTVAIANDTIRELWNQALPPDAVAQWLAVLSSAEMAAEAALAAATLAAVDQPATAAYALAARQAFQQRLDAARTWIATQRMMIAGWDSYRDAVRRGVEAYRQRLAPHEQFLDGMVSAYNSYFSSILVEPPASGWASGPMYVSTDYPGFDLEGWNQAQAAIQAIKAEEMFTAYNVASAQCENRIFHENLEHAAAAIAGAFADRTGSAGDVLAPRLFVVGQPAPEDIDPAVAIRQRYGVSMLIGDEAAGLYDVDVNIGAVHAYPDELSQQYAGANGAHRMKEALMIIDLDLKGGFRLGSVHKATVVPIPSAPEDFKTKLGATHLFFPKDCLIDANENQNFGLIKASLDKFPSSADIRLVADDGAECLDLNGFFQSIDSLISMINLINTFFGYPTVDAAALKQSLLDAYGIPAEEVTKKMWYATPNYTFAGKKSPIRIKVNGEPKGDPIVILIKQPIRIEKTTSDEKRFEKFEAIIHLDDDYFHHATQPGLSKKDVFDAYDADKNGEKIIVDARFRLMSGGADEEGSLVTIAGKPQTYDVPCFAMKDSSGQTTPTWKVRFSPPFETTGTQFWDVSVRAGVWHMNKGNSATNYDEYNQGGTAGAYYHYFGYNNDSDFAPGNQHKAANKFYSAYDADLPKPRIKFKVAAGTKSGPLEVGGPNPRYFHHQAASAGGYLDKPFFVLGGARPWVVPNGVNPPPWGNVEGIDRQTDVYAKMTAAGMNFNYTWFAPWETQMLHRKQAEFWYGGAGAPLQVPVSAASWRPELYYDQGRAKRMDEIIEGHEANNIYMALTVWAHQSLQDVGHGWGEIGWSGKAQTQENNGLSAVMGNSTFFASAADQTSSNWLYQKDYYRYIVARYGYSRAVAMWVTIDELEGVGNNTTYWFSNLGTTNGWHDALLSTVREFDFMKRPTTASTTYWGMTSDPYNEDGNGPDTEVVDGHNHGGWNGGSVNPEVLSMHAYHNVYHPTAYAAASSGNEYLWVNGGPAIWRAIPDQQALLWHYAAARMHTWPTNTGALGKPSLVTEFGFTERSVPTDPIPVAQLRSYFHYVIWSAFANGQAGTPLKWCDGKEFGEMFSRAGGGFESYPDLGQEMTALKKLVSGRLDLAQLSQRITGLTVQAPDGSPSSVRAFGLSGGGKAVIWLFDDDFDRNWGPNWGKSARTYANDQRASKRDHIVVIPGITGGSVKRYGTWDGSESTDPPGSVVGGSLRVPVGDFSITPSNPTTAWDGADVVLIIE